MYVITGATGNIGRQATDILLAQGKAVRVVGRSAARLQPMVDRGAEAAIGDLKDASFVIRAFSGATAVFTMIPPDLTVPDLRAYQNLISDNLAAAISKCGVKYVVNLSSQGAELAAGTGPILGLRDQEERLNRLEGVNVLHLRPTYFMENLLANIPLIHTSGIIGTAVAGDLKLAMIATRDIASFAAEHLVRRDFSGKKSHDLLGQRDLSLREATAVIGRRIGIPHLKYVQFSYGEATIGLKQMGISADVGRQIIEMSRAFNNGLIAVGRQRTPDNTTRTSIEEFADIFAQHYEAQAPRKAA